MNRRTDCCPRACDIAGEPAAALPTVWTLTLVGASGTYRCPACGHGWVTSFRDELEVIAWP